MVMDQEQNCFMERGDCWEVWSLEKGLEFSGSSWALWRVPSEEYYEWLGYFSNLVSFMIGDGSRICFWHDLWCKTTTLKSSFPELYSIALEKETLVSDYLDSPGTFILWNLSFTRVQAVQDWELESLDFFLNLLYCLKIYPEVAYRMLWMPGNNHGFEVKRYYKFL